MKKIKLNNKKDRFWVTGLSGVGKTTISKKLIKLIEKKFGKTIVINGDDLRKIFELKKYDIKSRKEYVLQYSRLCKFYQTKILMR